MDGAISTKFVTSEKSRGAATNLKFVRIVPTTGVSSVSGRNIQWRLPAQSVGTYLDMNSSYMKMDVVSKTGSISLSPAGVGGFFRSVVVRNQGQYLSSIDNYGLWRNIHTKNIDEEFLKRDGSIIMGTKNKSEGTDLVANTKKTFCEFLPNLSALFQTDKYLPLFSSDSIEIDITLGEAGYNLNYGAGGEAAHAAQSEGLKFENLEMYLAVITVSPQVDREIISAHSGMFKYLTNNTGSFTSVIEASNHQFNFNIGASYSSINSIHCVLTEQKTADIQNLSKFVKSTLKKATLLVDGAPLIFSLGQNSVNSAENLCYARIAQHALTDMSVYQMDDVSTYDTESFVLSLECETLNEKSSVLRSGFNSSSSILQLILEFDGTTKPNLNLQCFVQYDALISLDLNGTNNFEISI